MSSLPSVSDAFARLHPGVQRWLWEQSWTELRDVQERCVEPILAGRDVIVAAGTAYGKTEAAFLPIGSALASGGRTASVQALCVSPLKALINDQFERLDLFFERLDIPVHRWHGDVPASRKQRVIREPSGVLLITPESLEALFVVHGPRIARVFSGLRYVVVDELHAFLATERGRQLQSLLHRLELAIERRVPRIGLSATLGDMALAARYLRPDAPGEVEVVVSAEAAQEVRLQVRGYLASDPALTPDDGTFGDKVAIGEHLFATLRGTDNLVFANRRTDVEEYADLLRRLCERAVVPNEFWPHHGSLARELREDVERMLKERSRPVTAVCTTTLELGIDIGSVASIAQIGAPPSVASLRQRLGRSGRRGDPAVIRAYVREDQLTDRSAVEDRLRTELVQTIAMVRLLIAGFVEPPVSGRLHLSTLVQQLMSLIAERGGVTSGAAFEMLCTTGPFASVDDPMWADLIGSLSVHDLVQRAGDGTLLLGMKGERLVNHQTFFTAFATPEEYELTAGGKVIGTLPIDHPVHEGSHLIFAGRRWRVVAVDAERRSIDLAAGEAGRAPTFLGSGEPVHDRVRQEMRAVYEEDGEPAFCDTTARGLLREAREWYGRLGLASSRTVDAGRQTLVFPWAGDRVTDTIVLLMQKAGLQATNEGVAIAVLNARASAVERAIAELEPGDPAAARELAAIVANVRSGRYDEYLSDDLARAEYASRALDVPGARRAIGSLRG